MTKMSEDSKTLIDQKISEVLSQVSYGESDTRIVPLFQILSNYPIWFYEIENLTRASAIKRITEYTGHAPELEPSSVIPLSGFFYAFQFQDTYLGCIFVEKKDKIARRRFSAAHEFGHYKLHFEPLMSSHENGLLFTDETIMESSGSESNITSGNGTVIALGPDESDQTPVTIIDDTKETEANIFAAGLLMPGWVIQKRLENFRVSPGQPYGYLASRLASEFLVSKEAMMYRLNGFKTEAA